MFYVGHHLKTRISFPHSCMKDLGDYPYLFKHLKQAIQGRCLPQNGFLIQILTMKGYEKQKGIRIHSIEVTEEACQAIIHFDCLCFKPQKGDIIDFIVHEISNDMIHGKLGAAEVIIPRQRMSSLIYNESDNVYETEENIGVKQMITIASSLRCRVLEWVVHGDSNMKIIAEVDQLLLESKFPNKYE